MRKFVSDLSKVREVRVPSDRLRGLVFLRDDVREREREEAVVVVVLLRSNEVPAWSQFVS